MSNQDSIATAAKWLAGETPFRLLQTPIIPETRKRFGLSAVDALKAYVEAVILKRRMMHL